MNLMRKKAKIPRNRVRQFSLVRICVLRRVKRTIDLINSGVCPKLERTDAQSLQGRWQYAHAMLGFSGPSGYWCESVVGSGRPSDGLRV
jgi:hypothetical protein